jgi:hypothetical protein
VNLLSKNLVLRMAHHTPVQKVIIVLTVIVIHNKVALVIIAISMMIVKADLSVMKKQETQGIRKDVKEEDDKTIKDTI